jgi:hypothetical protein
MRTHLVNKDNIEEFNTNLTILYNKSIHNFENQLLKYRDIKQEIILGKDLKSVLGLKPTKDTKMSKGVEYTANDFNILITELEDTIEQFKDKEFEIFFKKWGIELLEKIRYSVVKEHTNMCITRAIFDILFKYTTDLFYSVPFLCCDNLRFETMQFEILRDLRWKIRIV